MLTATKPDKLPLEVANRVMRRVFHGKGRIEPAAPSTDVVEGLTEVEFAWGLVYSMALEGRAELAHELRANVFVVCEMALGALDALRDKATRTGHASPELDKFDALHDDLRRKIEYRERKWKTPEDLEYLAAESLAPSPEMFQRLEDARPFPQAWYDDDSPCPF